MMEHNKQVSNFFTSYNDELVSKMNRLDLLIGKDHWLSSGTYKEKLLRDSLSSFLPKKFEVSTGFIFAIDENGEEIKSKQQDIIIWNSHEYSALFRDDDFVIVPPDACLAVIEVKSNLTNATLKKALESTENFYKFNKTPYVQNLNIAKYIFSFKSDISENNSIDKYYSAVDDFYKSSHLSLRDRLSCSQHNNRSRELFSIDGIFLLDQGAILREFNFAQELPHLIFKGYTTTEGHIYIMFAHLLLKKINAHDKGQYAREQIGLSSLLQSLHLKKIDEELTIKIDIKEPSCKK